MILRPLVLLLVTVLLSISTYRLAPAQLGGSPIPESTSASHPAGLPGYDHIVIVVEENKDYDEVIGSAAAPYINTVLKAEGANFTRMYGEEHYSQGNYFWLFSGSNQSVGFHDQVPTTLFMSRNLGEQLITKCKPTQPYTQCLSFKGYAEDLPSIGSTVDAVQKDGCNQDCMIYGRKHVPWISFANVPNGRAVETSSDLRFEDFPRDFSQLPTVAFVIPNLENDMHNGSVIPDMVRRGDDWLRTHIDPYYQWAKSHNSLLILTFDENNDKRKYVGLTNPAVNVTDEYTKDLQNRTVTIFAGAHIKPGDYEERPAGINHVTILRTIEAMYGLSRSGAQQPNAAAAGIGDEQIITDVFAMSP
jgi:phosphatidylinositol-3-phosphatase